MDIEVKIEMLCAIALSLPDNHPLVSILLHMMEYMHEKGYDSAHICTGYTLVNNDDYM